MIGKGNTNCAEGEKSKKLFPENLVGSDPDSLFSNTAR